MDLPKNITQIGESDRNCRIYVEDYVVSYIKQINGQAENRQQAVALYGICKIEQEVSYLFFYGACKLQSLDRTVRHLSQAQNQEIEKLRKRYFPEYKFLGYRLLNGEMVEGFHVCEQGICRYISGYACFYEKNDSMLAYMLDTREGDVPPEKVDQDKFEQVRQKQEARRRQFDGDDAIEETDPKEDRSKNQESIGKRNSKRATQESVKLQTELRKSEKRRSQKEKVEQAVDSREKDILDSEQEEQVTRKSAGRVSSLDKSPSKRKYYSAREHGQRASSATLRLMRGGVVGMFVLLCIVGLTTLNGYDKMEQLQVAAKQLWDEFTEKKIPDAGDAVAAMSQSGQADTLVAEDKLADAIAQENIGQGQNSDQSNQSGSGQEASNQNPSQQPGQAGQENGQPAPNDSQGTEVQNSGEPNGDATGAAEQTGNTGNVNPPEQGGNEQPESGSSEPDPNTGAQSTEGQNNNAQDNTQQETPRQNGEAQNNTGESSDATSTQAAVETVLEPTSYTICAGDTLIGICTKLYGSDARVQEVCTLNNISNPDNIRIGQKILLPQ